MILKTLIRRINWYPPLLGMGIRVRKTDEHFRRFEVELRPKWYTRNLFGTHFGGSLYTMTDPFYVFILTVNLGREYIVWDQSARIDFLKPAKGTITGIFELDEATIEAIRASVDDAGKGSFDFETTLTDESGVAVAKVEKTVYVRRKQR